MAPKNASSMIRNSPATGSATSPPHAPALASDDVGQHVVMAIVAVTTAMPYAAASALEERKPSTSATTPTSSTRLSPGR